MVFSLRPDTERGKRGPGKITIVQDRTPLDLTFKVVGEAHDIQFTNLETNLEVGADGGVADPDAGSPDALPSVLASRLKVTATKDDDCALPGTASGFLSANGTAQRTVTLVRAFDSDGTSITGAFIRWQSDAPDVGTVAAPLTPPHLGSFGIGAPNIAQDGASRRSTSMRGRAPPGRPRRRGSWIGGPRISRVPPRSPGGAPATIALTASPSAMNCDGAASTVGQRRR